MLQPTVRRTWAPKGKTPILKCYDRRDRLSAISAVTVSPKRRRLGLYFDILDHNVKAEDFEAFVERLLRRVGRPIILVIDRYSVHRSAAKKLLARHRKRLSIEWLPAMDWRNSLEIRCRETRLRSMARERTSASRVARVDWSIIHMMGDPTMARIAM